MASIALSVIGCIDYLAYGTIFTRAMFLPKKKLDVFFPARKAVDACREVVSMATESHHGQLGISLAFPPFDVGGGNFTMVLEVAYVDKDSLHK
jgi:hypothetical protein